MSANRVLELPSLAVDGTECQKLPEGSFPVGTATTIRIGIPHPELTESSLHEGVSRMSVSIKPLEDRVVIKPLEAEQTTASGLVIPDTAKEKPQEGEVVAVGEGRFDEQGKRIPVDVKVGDKVVFSKYGGTELKYGDQEYLVLGSRDILAIIEN